MGLGVDGWVRKEGIKKFRGRFMGCPRNKWTVVMY